MGYHNAFMGSSLRHFDDLLYEIYYMLDRCVGKRVAMKTIDDRQCT